MRIRTLVFHMQPPLRFLARAYRCFDFLMRLSATAARRTHTWTGFSAKVDCYHGERPALQSVPGGNQHSERLGNPMIPMIRILLVSVFLLTGLRAQESKVDESIQTIAGLDIQQARAFFGKVKRAVDQGDRKAIARWVAYPTQVDLKGAKNVTIRTRAEFESHFDEIMNTKVVDAVRKQTYEGLFVNYQGVMFGNGEIWFSAIKGPGGKFDQYRIIKINN